MYEFIWTYRPSILFLFLSIDYNFATFFIFFFVFFFQFGFNLMLFVDFPIYERETHAREDLRQHVKIAKVDRWCAYIVTARERLPISSLFGRYVTRARVVSVRQPRACSVLFIYTQLVFIGAWRWRLGSLSRAIHSYMCTYCIGGRILPQGRV